MGGHETVGPGAKLPRQTSEPSDYCPFGLVNCPLYLQPFSR